MKGLSSATAPALGRSRSLRLLRASRLRQQTTEAPSVAFSLALLAIFLEFAISGNTLNVLGINYDAPGGNPLVKLLPGTYVAAVAAMCSLAAGARHGRGAGHLINKAPSLVLFLLIVIFCAFYAAANVGLMGAGVYVDTYLSAIFFAIVMVDASDRQRAILARLILTLCVIDVVLSVWESLRQEHLIPFRVNGELDQDTRDGEFRPAAFYTHPLTGAMGTAFGLFLLLETDMPFQRAAVIFGVLFVGLLSFGGRAALVAAVGLVVLRVMITFARDLLYRKFNGRLIGAIAVAVCVLLPATTYLLVATPIGERIVRRSYYDDSAEVRADQWAVLGQLTPKEAMFGTPATSLQQVYAQVGLNGVENPLILMFLNLGLIGFPIFSAGLVIYVRYLYRAHPRCGWLLTAAIVILSGSNSVGTKSPDLFMMTACAVAMGSRRSRPVPAATRPKVQPSFRLSLSGAEARQSQGLLSQQIGKRIGPTPQGMSESRT
jgi:hypothetical protein